MWRLPVGSAFRLWQVFISGVVVRIVPPLLIKLRGSQHARHLLPAFHALVFCQEGPKCLVRQVVVDGRRARRGWALSVHIYYGLMLFYSITVPPKIIYIEHWSDSRPLRIMEAYRREQNESIHFIHNPLTQAFLLKPKNLCSRWSLLAPLYGMPLWHQTYY